jgi:hypothetical protein
LLQSNGWKMGITIDWMPKCHCELGGESVEYSWACTKNEFRRIPIRLKKAKISLSNSKRMPLMRSTY